MQDFELYRPKDLAAACAAAAQPGAAFIAGGSDLVQLMKQEVERPTRLVDLDGIVSDTIASGPDGIRIGALARMSDVAAHAAVARDCQAVSEALLSAASPQIRNMGTIGGNLLQRTRCNYFRDPGFAACNKRLPGSGCGALQGENRLLGILGVSRSCIATHPSDMPVALSALDAAVEILGSDGSRRRVPIDAFYRLPGDTPENETVLQPGDLVEAVVLPRAAAGISSRYVKVRDRASFEFALVSCAVALRIEDGAVADVRIAAGGVAPLPWRLPQVEAFLQGRRMTDALPGEAAALAGEGATPAGQNMFKVKLLQRAVQRALERAA